MQLPNGELNAEQLRFLGDCIAPYGENGCADITTRASIQLRGVVLEDADKIIDGLRARGMHSFCSGMDNVRNLTGNPIAGACHLGCLISAASPCLPAASLATGCSYATGRPIKAPHQQ
jgi:sulfite reductase beta subunit-like hemoprotein